MTLIKEGLAVLERTPARLEFARATIEPGVALRRERRRSEARAQLVRGADLAHRCGADMLAARARDELVSLGARSRRAAFSGVSSLTVSELRVAQLAAAGMTNRAIAHELTVSVKTVSGQLTAVYRKLDIHDRAALVIAMQAADHRDQSFGESDKAVVRCHRSLCRGDPEFEGHVRGRLRREAALNPDVILAEISAVPETEVGLNITQRPVLREWEIDYGGLSGAHADPGRHLRVRFSRSSRRPARRGAPGVVRGDGACTGRRSAVTDLAGHIRA